jgi:hypothetical protein
MSTEKQVDDRDPWRHVRHEAALALLERAELVDDERAELLLTAAQALVEHHPQPTLVEPGICGTSDGAATDAVVAALLGRP